VDTEQLHSATAKLAAACLLARHWPKRGGHYEASYPLAGWLIGDLNWPKGEAADFVEAVCRAAGDEQAHDRRSDAESTADSWHRYESACATSLREQASWTVSRCQGQRVYPD
jgi:hypothetical protein